MLRAPPRHQQLGAENLHQFRIRMGQAVPAMTRTRSWAGSAENCAAPGSSETGDPALACTRHPEALWHRMPTLSRSNVRRSSATRSAREDGGPARTDTLTTYNEE